MKNNKNFTERELKVLKLLTLGKSNEEIADSLTVTESTVKAHISSILKKSETHDRLNVVLKALHEGWV